MTTPNCQSATQSRNVIFRAREHRFELQARVLVMGVVNVTPDSFADGGRQMRPDDAVDRGLRLIEEGADIVDIGGESTRPGATPVDAAEECRRVLPVVRALRAQSSIPLSVDTYKAPVARACLAEGADIVNDISGFTRDPDMPAAAAEFGAGCIVMHMRGTPQTMQSLTDYADLPGELEAYFRERVDALVSFGIEREYICLDPGIGFSKTVAQNLQLINDLGRLTALGLPVLLGPSRKSFIGKTLEIPDPARRDWGTAAAVACGVMRGARLVRVHEVGSMKEVARMALAISLAAG